MTETNCKPIDFCYPDEVWWAVLAIKKDSTHVKSEFDWLSYGYAPIDMGTCIMVHDGCGGILHLYDRSQVRHVDGPDSEYSWENKRHGPKGPPVGGCDPDAGPVSEERGTDAAREEPWPGPEENLEKGVVLDSPGLDEAIEEPDPDAAEEVFEGAEMGASACGVTDQSGWLDSLEEESAPCNDGTVEADPNPRKQGGASALLRQADYSWIPRGLDKLICRQGTDCIPFISCKSEEAVLINFFMARHCTAFIVSMFNGNRAGGDPGILIADGKASGMRDAGALFGDVYRRYDVPHIVRALEQNETKIISGKIRKAFLDACLMAKPKTYDLNQRSFEEDMALVAGGLTELDEDVRRVKAIIGNHLRANLEGAGRNGNGCAENGRKFY